MATSNMISLIKDGLLIASAIGGIMTGLYSQIAKPIHNETRLLALETKINEIKPTVEEDHINVAVLTSKLNELKETQDKIFNAVLDIKKRL